MPTVYGDSVSNFGVRGRSTYSFGVSGASQANAGVVGDSSSYPGVLGRAHSPVGVGVSGINSTTDGNTYGVRGEVSSEGGCGVLGTGPGGATGVWGSNGDDGIGVWGTSVTGYGVRAHSRGGWAVYADDYPLDATSPPGKAGVFVGSVDVHGDFTVFSINKKFKIDHPLDPENRYLQHNAVESSERKNVYDGVVQLDDDGEAWVDLPEWLEALNGDFRYQLTAVSGAAPNLHVAEEISENRFKIAGGEGGMKVCWQVTGSIKDPWAAANPFEVEEEKPQEERGRYLQPSLYGAPEERSVMRARMGETREPPQEPSQAPEEPPSFEPPQPSEIPPGGTPEMPPSFPIDMQAEYRQQIDELRGQIEELRRVSLEEEIDELRGQIKKLRRRKR